MRDAALVTVLILVLAVGTASADGGGGYFNGFHVSEFPGLEELTLASSDLGIVYQGGMGFGVSWRGLVSGGFGVGLIEADNPNGIAGGFGGAVSGWQLIRRPVQVLLLSQVGLGGFANRSSRLPDEPEGYFAMLAEGTINVGLPLGFMMPVAYAGYQVVGSFGPAGPFQDRVFYSPTLGFRVLFGGF